MAKVTGIRFRNVGKIYYFDPKNYKMKIGDHVIVETARGVEYGKVVMAPKEVAEDEVVHPLKEVLRVATEEDDEREKQNRVKEKEAFRICRKKILEHNLDMKLIDAEYTFDNNKVLFYFTADGRIDFRQLVKDLASVFKTRIELRQIGVRDETKILGGIGSCGRCLCCHTYLSEFAPVSIKMAKEQNLSLNQTKISGVCGRLMCCLKNEQETYEELNKNLPGNGDTVILPDGTQGTVHSVNVLRQRVKVVVEINDEKEIQDYPVEELKFRPRKKKGKSQEKDSGEDKDLREDKEEKGSKDSKDLKGSKEPRDSKDARESRDLRNPKESRNSRESRENRNFSENKNSREGKEFRNQKEPKNQREPRNQKESRSHGKKSPKRTDQ